ncbi:hypothetical protein OPIT5_04310 [Opitutaceae bacterium TAV5]|nr:hypothetical protein OPIT5_04310 [Opitutaceae bacterium TAV5]
MQVVLMAYLVEDFRAGFIALAASRKRDSSGVTGGQPSAYHLRTIKPAYSVGLLLSGAL